MVKKTGWFIFFLAMAAACLEEPECFSLNNNYVGISFKKLSDNTKDTLFFTRITTNDDGTDVVFLDRLQAVPGTIDRLPLNYFQDSTVFYFEAADTTYELHLSYLAQAQFVSEDCGERFVLSGLKVGKGTNFDSVRLVSTTPKSSGASGSHLEIYRCPDINRVKLAFSREVGIEDINLDYDATVVALDDTLSTITIPLNTAALTSTIQFEFTDGTNGTLKLEYDSISETRFRVCGPQTLLYQLKVNAAETTFTNIQLLTDSIQDPPRTNLAITF